MERMVPDVTEPLLYSNRMAVAFEGIAFLKVVPATRSASVWDNPAILTVTVVIVLCAKVTFSIVIDLLPMGVETIMVTSFGVENFGTITSKYSVAKGSTVFIDVLSVLQRLTECEPVAEGMTIASELSPVIVAVPIPLR